MNHTDSCDILDAPNGSGVWASPIRFSPGSRLPLMSLEAFVQDFVATSGQAVS